MRGPKNTAVIAQKKLNPDATKKTKTDKSAAKKDKASSKNSGAPKRPPTAFFVFMEEFRKLCKENKENFPDNKPASVVAKEGGAKWKSMSDSEKAPYVAKAATKKAEYGIAMKQHNDDLVNNETAKEKSISTSKSSTDTNDDVDQEASS